MKWQFQPRKRTRSWRATIAEQPDAIADSLAQSPSLEQHLRDNLSESYRRALPSVGSKPTAESLQAHQGGCKQRSEGAASPFSGLGATQPWNLIPRRRFAERDSGTYIRRAALSGARW